MKEKSLKIKFNFDKCYINQIFGEFAINYKYVTAIITLLNYTNKNSDKILCYLTMYKVSKNLRILSSYTIKSIFYNLHVTMNKDAEIKNGTQIII